MRFVLIFFIFAILLATILNAEALNKEQDTKGELSLEEYDDYEDYDDEDLILIDGIEVDIGALSDHELEQFLLELANLNELPIIEMDNVSEVSETDVTPINCRHSCSRVYWPVCATFDEQMRTISSHCELQNEIRCANSALLLGEQTPVVRLLHEGACKKHS